MHRSIGVLLFFISSLALHGQRTQILNKELGHPHIHNHTPEEYGATAQNWSIVQDHRGVMYFGNNRGIIEYDGVSWRVIPAADNTIIRSMAIDENGRIYVGAFGDFGFLETSDQGLMEFHSLKSKIDVELKDFEDVWSINIGKDGVYFHSAYNLIKLRGDSIKVWKTAYSYHRSFMIDEKLYLRQEGIGLMVMENDSLKLLPGGQQFEKEFVSAMIPISNNRLLIGSRTQGLFMYDTKSKAPIAPFRTANDKLLKNAQIYHGVSLTENVFALASLTDGIFIMDDTGKIIQHFDRTIGLLGNNVLNLYKDRNNTLWAALGNGIAHIDVFSSAGFFGENSNLKEAVYGTISYDSTLFAATNGGIYYLDKYSQLQPTFQKVSGFTHQSWCFHSYEFNNQKKLLAGSNGGIWDVRKTGTGYIAEQITDQPFAFTFYAPPDEPSKLYAGLKDGVIELNLDENGAWNISRSIPDVDEKILSITSDSKNLWLGTNYSGVIRINQATQEVKRYDTSHGLPSNHWNHIYFVNDELIVATTQGIYTFDSEKESFVLHPEIAKAFNKSRWIYKLDPDLEGNLWFDSDLGKGVLLRTESGYKLVEDQLKIFRPTLENEISVYVSPDDIVWFGSNKGLSSYKYSERREGKPTLNTLIRKVVTSGDSIVFYGASVSEKITSEKSSIPELQSDRNSISIEYATSYYTLESENQYSSLLEGYDNDWSNWSKETRKAYTNLPGGDYVFRVKSKNVFGDIGSEVTYRFHVLTPFYETWWAKTIYLLLGILMVIGYSKWRNFTLKQNKRQLEELVLQRTQELKALNENLESLVAKRTQDLEDKNKRLQDYAFTNAHELRSPIVNLLGIVDLYESSYDNDRNLIEMAKSEIIRLNEITYEIQENLSKSGVRDKEYPSDFR